MYSKDTIVQALTAAGVDVDSFLELLEASKKTQWSTNMPFGKYKGETLLNILTIDPKYIHYLHKQDYIKEKFEDIYEEVCRLLE